MSDFDSFLSKAAEISERQAESDRKGAEHGFYYCTPLEAGILLDPATPAYIAQARTQIRYTNTPQGIALWEHGAQETQRKLEQLLGSREEVAEPEVQSPFTSTKLST